MVLQGLVAGAVELPPSGPELLPPHPYGGGCTAYTRVTPEVFVELSVDLALEGLRWRHPVRFVRVRGELTAADLAGGSRITNALRRATSTGCFRVGAIAASSSIASRTYRYTVEVPTSNPQASSA